MPLETKILVGFRLGIVAVLAASLLFFRAKLQLVESTQRLSRTDEVPAELEGTFPSL
jgi:CHASE3 domain sensor protein